MTAAGLLTIAPASANVNRDWNCTARPGFEIIKDSAPQVQCFDYDNSGSRTLLVNDWYKEVYSYGESVTAKWREIKTGAIITGSGYGPLYQPQPNGDPNYYLVNVTVN
ncbi:hypothetical protein [Catenulispora yoronensis]|uniref:hypothetical protein n=1 Tax=Catenulispora yoronensis TaxID=450799 RepID=UPI0031DDC743